MSIDEAFEQILNEKSPHYLWNRTGKSLDYRRNLKKDYRLGKVSTDKKLELLRAAGFEVIQETKLGLKGGFERSSGE